MYFQKILQRFALMATVAILFSPFVHTQKTKVPKGFSCVAALTIVKQLSPELEAQKAKTNFTLGQLNSFVNALRLRTEIKPSNKDVHVSENGDYADTRNDQLVANRIAGILQANKMQGDDNQLLNLGITLQGKTNISAYFEQIKTSINTYQSMVEKNDLFQQDPFLEDERWPTAAGLLAAATAFAPFATPIHTLNEALTLLTGAATAVALHGATAVWGRNEKQLPVFLDEVMQFLAENGSADRYLYYSQNYKIYPETFVQATTTGFVSTNNLAKENNSALNSPIRRSRALQALNGTPFPDQPTYVMIDYLIDSWKPSPETEKTVLHIFIRASKTEIKYPNKPTTPISEEEDDFSTVKQGQLAPIPIYVRPH
jgi:hypothetical protein